MAASFASAETVGQIYDAAVDPGGWARLPEILMQAAGGGTSGFVGIMQPGVAPDSVTCGLPPEALDRYSAYYHWVNPLHATACALGVSMHVVRGSDIYPDLKFRQTEFYTDFARSFETVQIRTPIVPLAPGVIGEIGVHRGGRDRRFDRRGVAGVQRLLPHVQRALQLRRRLGLHQSGALGFAALETLTIGCVICDAEGRVVFANKAAEMLEAMAAGISISGLHGIATSHGDEARLLSALIHDTARGGSGGPLILSGANGARLFALVAPLPLRFSERPRHVLVTLRTTTAPPSFDTNHLRDLFGLTVAEARLGHALAAGRSLSEIGIAHRVSENTLRTQLASVLRKTGVASQRELVRLLNLLPPLPLAQRTEP